VPCDNGGPVRAARQIGLGLASALLAGCPINPSVDPAGKLCHAGSDPCPTAFDCYQNRCIPACSGAPANPALAPTLNVLEPRVCHCTSDCALGQVCHPDPYWQTQGLPAICATPCTTTVSDCVDPSTVCRAGFCQLDACAPIDAPCDAQQANADGTCLPVLDGGAGVCVQGGQTNVGVCTPGADRSAPSELCDPGQFCVPDSADAFGVCQVICDPQDLLNTPCAPGSCVTYGGRLGLCTDAG